MFVNSFFVIVVLVSQTTLGNNKPRTMDRKPNPVITLAEAVESVLHINPKPLSPEDVPEDVLECMVLITRLDGEFNDIWFEIKESIWDILHDYSSFDMHGYRSRYVQGYTSRYIDLTDTTDRLVLFRDIRRVDEQASLKLEYHVSGEIKIKSSVNLHSGESGTFPDIQEKFVCGDIQSISPEDVVAAKQRLLNQQR